MDKTFYFNMSNEKFVNYEPNTLMSKLPENLYSTYINFFQSFFLNEENVSLAATEFLNSHPSGTILDIGAGLGYHSLIWAKTYPEAEIMAFEPHPGYFSALKQNAKNYNNLKVFEEAIWKNDGKAILLDKGPMSFISENPKDNGIKVKTRSLKDHAFDKKVQLVKIDTEGTEFEVLLFLEGLIKDHLPIILFENRNLPKLMDSFFDKKFFEIEALVKSMGYKVKEISGGVVRNFPILGKRNFMAVPNI